MRNKRLVVPVYPVEYLNPLVPMSTIRTGKGPIDEMAG